MLSSEMIEDLAASMFRVRIYVSGDNIARGIIQYSTDLYFTSGDPFCCMSFYGAFR